MSVDGPNIEDDAMAEECSSWYFGDSSIHVIKHLVCNDVMQGRYVSIRSINDTRSRYAVQGLFLTEVKVWGSQPPGWYEVIIKSEAKRW